LKEKENQERRAEVKGTVGGCCQSQKKEPKDMYKHECTGMLGACDLWKRVWEKN